jgi:hypothetical protein
MVHIVSVRVFSIRNLFFARLLSRMSFVCSKCQLGLPYIHYIIRFPWMMARGNGAKMDMFVEIITMTAELLCGSLVYF